MNFGTKLRTALRIAASINNALCMTSVAINDFHIGWLSWLWIALTIASDFVISAITTYFNNDYNEIAAKHTGNMRQEKAEQEQDYVGERFYDEPELHELLDEEGADVDE